MLNAGWFYDPDYEWGVASSPIIWKNLVIVQCDIQQNSFVAAFDVKTGKPVWRTSRDEIPSWSTPTVIEMDGHTELVTQGTNAIRGYDPTTGKELWRLTGNSEVTVPTPIAGPGTVIVTNGYRGVQPIFAIKPGAPRRHHARPATPTSSPSIAWSTKRGGPYMPTPIVYGDQLYVVLNNGTLAAYDAKTGERLYQERLGGKGGAFSASPVAADGKIYLTSEDGDVFVVKAGRTYELLATNPVGEVLMATPAIADGVLFIRGMKHVIAIAAAEAGAGDRRRRTRRWAAGECGAASRRSSRCSTRPTIGAPGTAPTCAARSARIEPHQVTWRPGPGRHNVWELVVHAAYWKYVVRKRVSGAPRGGFPLAGSNFFPREGLFDPERWQADLELLADQHRQLRAMVAALERRRPRAPRRRQAARLDDPRRRRPRPVPRRPDSVVEDARAAAAARGCTEGSRSMSRGSRVCASAARSRSRCRAGVRPGPAAPSQTPPRQRPRPRRRRGADARRDRHLSGKGEVSAKNEISIFLFTDPNITKPACRSRSARRENGGHSCSRPAARGLHRGGLRRHRQLQPRRPPPPGRRWPPRDGGGRAGGVKSGKDAKVTVTFDDSNRM